jgi:hypothetical protein
MRARCIAAVSRAAGREITQAEADGIEQRIRDNMRELARQDLQKFQSQAVATRLDEAAKLAAKQLATEAADTKRMALRAVQTHDAIEGSLAEMQAAGMDRQQALRRTLFVNNDGRSRGTSLEERHLAIQEDYARRLTGTFEAVGPKVFGMMANKEGAGLVTRELFGQDTGSAMAKRAAKAWSDVADAMAGHFKDAGGILNRLADWRYPQHHDQLRVFGDGSDQARQAWKDDIGPKLDRTRYVHENGRYLDDAEFDALLSESWDSIATGGANKIEPGQGGRSASIAKRELAHRVLHFKDAEGYIAYQDRFGGKDLWATMTGNVGRMAREISLMEQFGPNADHEFAFQNDTALRDSRHARTNAAAEAQDIANAYRYLAGYTNGVTNSRTARAFEEGRNVMVAAHLGSALWSSIPDVGTLTMTAAYNRVGVWGAYSNALRALFGSAEGRDQLEHAGLMMSSTMQSARRFQVDSLGQSFTGKMAQGILRVSGLTHWTDALRGGYAATHMRALGNLIGRHETLADVPAVDRKLLEAHGVTDLHYQVWRQAELEGTNFGRLLTPDAIYGIGDDRLAALALRPDQVTIGNDALRRDAAQKILGIAITESHMAVVEPGAADRLMMGGGASKGDVKGELSKAFWQFKSFPWAFVRKHFVERGWEGQDTVGGKLRYIAPLFVMSSLMGALAVEIQDMLAGKQPRPLYGGDGKVMLKNWIAAVLKGGALGVYGDFLAGEASGDARSALGATLGPLPNTVAQLGNLTLGNAVAAMGNAPTHFGQEAVNFGKQLTPGANLWYTKAATDHYIFDYVQDQLNPGYLSRMQARAERQFGSRYWWQPGRPIGTATQPNVGRVIAQQ